MNRLTALLLFALFALPALAQVNVKSSKTAGYLIRPKFGAFTTGGDMTNTFGGGLEAGLDLGYKWPENWIFTFEGSYLFGSNVKIINTVFANLATNSGPLLNTAGQFAQVNVNLRGFTAGIKVSKILPVLDKNPSSGVILGLGGGYIRHWMATKIFQDFVPQVQGDYAKGYDRMHGGPYVTQSIGYHHAGNRRKINFLLTLEFTQAFTQNLRGFNFDTGLADTGAKLDLLSGIRFTWFFPIYREADNEFYYY